MSAADSRDGDATDDALEVASEVLAEVAPTDTSEGDACDGCPPACVPGVRRCEGQVVLACGDDHVEVEVERCDGTAGEQCAAGRCATACELIGAKRGYVGCDYWAADLPNDETALDNVFAFAFSNVSPKPASVTVSYPWGPTATVVVPVGGLATHALPVPRTLSQIADGGIADKGFHIRSDQPIAAFMFNPLQRYDEEGKTVATNDASILIPETALGRAHVAVTWSDPAQFSGPPFVTVVALQDGTHVEVVPTETVGIQVAPFVLPAGVATTVTLDAAQTLNLEPGGALRSDLTGTRVTSLDHPVAVFSGNRCARVPDSGRFCDHVETQLPPLETWGKELVVMKFADRGGDSDWLRVVAQVDDTVVTFDPPLLPEATLAAGGFLQLATREDVVVRASHPIMVAQFMASQSTTTPPGPFGVSGDCPAEIGGTCQGDPALVLAAPRAQWRRDQIFLVPDTYTYQFIAVAFEASATITLDGAPVDTGAARLIGQGPFLSLTLPTSGGYHTLVGSEPVAVVVYGFDHNISYAYNGGLDFRDLSGE